MSHEIAARNGCKVFGYRGVTFFGSNAGFNRRLQAVNIKKHFYPNYDIVYVVKNDEGFVIAQGDAEFLSAIYSDVPLALKAYRRTKTQQRIKSYYIKRYFAFYGCLGPLRQPLYQFLSSADVSLILDSPAEWADGLVCAEWMQEEWRGAFVEMPWR
jgi:hypothetical protein